MSKTWGAIGAWAAEAEREEAEEKALAAAAAEAGGGAGNFPSLKEASSTKQKKKKMTLQEFTMQQTPARSKGLTPDEMLRLPTGPTQRAPGDEMPFGRLGGGFSNYGRRDREEGDRGGRRSYGGGFDEDRRGGAPPRVSDFDQPSRADEADNWAMGKKTSSIPSPSNRYSGLGGGGGMGMGMGMSRADEVDNWGAGKKPVAPVRSSTFGSSFRDSRPEPDRWSSRGGFGGGFGEGGEREVQSERRKLVLDPPRREGLGGEVVEQVKASSNKPNPFGTARPREEVLAEKGLDWKKVDLEIEAKKSSSSRPASEHSSRPSSAQSSRSEGLGLQGMEGGGVVKPRPKVNPFGDAKPREVLLQEKGMDWRKIDLDLEHRRVDRPETEAEKNLKEEIEHLKKELEKESSSHENHEPLEGPGDDKTNLRDQILIRQKDLELLTRELDDKVSFGQKAIERPGSGAGRVSSFPERPPSQSGAFEEPRSVEYMDRPRSRGTGDMWSRQGDDRRSFQGGRERGFLGNRDMDRIDEPTELHEMDLDESNNNATSVNRKLANARHLRQLRSGFPTPDEQNLSAPDPKSRGEEDSEPLQLQLHQYSDATIGISQHGSTSGTASERGVLSMEESIRLKELEETPSNPRELEQLNCDPMEVPPTISRHFSILCVLDLSYSEINSLPQSISILVALQKLYLRSCELLMELPPEIGELTNLKVLDLEGTEILYLPKEIAKLVNLTCLKVSFYGYANQRVIPLGVLPNLSRLIELIIDVTPYGAWWDDEVKDITDDLFSLDDLRTLKLYFPTAELLEGLTRVFSGLANFRFTVGRHEEHFISRLPHDVEEEFNNREKMERGLKFINGNHIPNEITKVLKHANAFVLQRHWTAKSLSDFGHENMNEVKFCLVTECNEFRTIIDSEQFYRGKDEEDFQDSDDVIALGLLEKLIVRFMKNIVSIWNGPVGKGCLSNLKSLALHTCPSLTTLFTIDMLSNLIYLEELVVEDCPKINSLVSLNSSSSESGLFLPNMKKISLLELPELVSISSGLCIAPKLERMVIFYCPKLEKLSTMDVSSTNLKVIKGEKEWWDALKWYESDLSTKHEDHLASIFIPLRRDGDLMAQLTKD